MASVSRRPPAPSQTPLRLACMIGSKAASNDGRPWAWSKDIYSCWWPTPSLRMTTTANMWRSSISFRPEKPIERKDDVMKKKDADTVRFQLDPGNLPPLTEAQRSEEHTSELQSLMRISYAVFCLKKKKTKTIKTNTKRTT